MTSLEYISQNQQNIAQLKFYTFEIKRINNIVLVFCCLKMVSQSNMFHLFASAICSALPRCRVAVVELLVWPEAVGRCRSHRSSCHLAKPV